MDEGVIERAKARIGNGWRGRAEAESALERLRTQLEDLAQSAAELEAALPERIGDAVRDGLRAEALPVARQLAETRGLSAQVIRRLERIEGNLAAERHARVDDLALLVDLIAGGWKDVSERLARLEEASAAG